MNDIPNWAYALITTLVTGAFSTLVAFLVRHAIQRKLDKVKNIEDKANEQVAYEKREEIKSLITESLTPVIENINSINEKIDTIRDENRKETKATVVTMRIKMNELYDFYTKRGYCDIHEKSTWNELYNEYKNLGGNHFDEYVNGWKSGIEKLPEVPHHKKKTNQNKIKLVE